MLPAAVLVQHGPDTQSPSSDYYDPMENIVARSTEPGQADRVVSRRDDLDRITEPA